jgi:putative FmdB family regulatory protein
MPTYEYRCKSCGEHLEVVQSFNDAPLTVCPACSGELRKVFGTIGIAFKGSGFYKTDSRSASKPAAASASSSSSSESSASSGDSSSSSSESSSSSTNSSSADSSSKKETSTASAAAS